MDRIVLSCVALLLLILAGYLYHTRPTRPLVSFNTTFPLAVADYKGGLETGKGTNLAASREDFAGRAWKPERLVVTGNAAIGPDGKNSAFRLSETLESGLHRTETSVSMPNAGTYTLSVFVRQGGRRLVQFEMRDGAPGRYGIACFDLGIGAAVARSGDVTRIGIQHLPGGWYRCWAAMPYNTDAAVFNFALLAFGDGGAGYVGTVGSALLVWGVQLEPGDEPNSYSAVPGA